MAEWLWIIKERKVMKGFGKHKEVKESNWDRVGNNLGNRENKIFLKLQKGNWSTEKVVVWKGKEKRR